MKRIRKACSFDFETIVQLLQQLSAYKPVDKIKWFGDESNQGYVMEQDSKIIGFLSCHQIKKIRGGNIFVVEDVIIDQSYRGCGNGKMLLSYAIQDIKRYYNVYKIILESSEIGEALYKSCGFQKSKNQLYKLMVE